MEASETVPSKVKGTDHRTAWRSEMSCYDNDVDDNDSGGGNDDDRDVRHHTEVEYCHKGFSTQFGEDSAGDHSGPNRSK